MSADRVAIPRDLFQDVRMPNRMLADREECCLRTVVLERL